LNGNDHDGDNNAGTAVTDGVQEGRQHKQQWVEVVGFAQMRVVRHACGFDKDTGKKTHEEKAHDVTDKGHDAGEQPSTDSRTNHPQTATTTESIHGDSFGVGGQGVEALDWVDDGVGGGGGGGGGGWVEWIGLKERSGRVVIGPLELVIGVVVDGQSGCRGDRDLVWGVFCVWHSFVPWKEDHLKNVKRQKGG